ncbi:MAG: ABC transporter substrate-binding protein [Actinomycetes bacterium]
MQARHAFSRTALGLVAATTATLALAACGSSSSTGAPAASGTPTTGGTAYYAEAPATPPNWIWPFMGSAYFSTQNIVQFQQLMYRPLYWFGQSGQPQITPSLSLADPPVYSNGNTTVTITLKPYRWSDGTSVSANDVAFWLNLMKAEKANWAAYVPGAIPDNIKTITATSPTTVTLELTTAVSPTWFTYNELSQVTPMPAAWDEAAAGVPSHCDTTISDCAAVYRFLDAQAGSLSTYATNPIWQVVDGPWKLSAFTTDGRATFKPNPAYSGPQKPRISTFVELPFTSTTAEYNELRSGGITVGYVPMTDVQAKPAGTPINAPGPNPVPGYTMAPWVFFGINYFPENFNNPTYGPVFKQLYFRQALQMTVDQQGYVNGPLKGYAYPTYGPVPLYPTNSFISAAARTNPYPFDPAKAGALLQAHGWTVTAGSPAVCTNPGAGPAQCGAGVKAGTKLELDLQYASGNPALTTEMSVLKSDAAQAGIVLNLSQAPFNTVTGNAVPCTATQKACSWQMESWGGGWSFQPDFYPTGGEIFATGAGSNVGSYTDPTNDANILATHSASNAQQAMDAYQSYLAAQLPVVWQPYPIYQLTEIQNGLHGVTPQNPTGQLTPETWYFTK